jgi:hypothetical protein
VVCSFQILVLIPIRQSFVFLSPYRRIQDEDPNTGHNCFLLNDPLVPFGFTHVRSSRRIELTRNKSHIDFWLEGHFSKVAFRLSLSLIFSFPSFGLYYLLRSCYDAFLTTFRLFHVVPINTGKSYIILNNNTLWINFVRRIKNAKFSTMNMYYKINAVSSAAYAVLWLILT